LPAKKSQASHAASNPAIILDSKAREAALEAFIASVRQRFETRFPGIAYDSLSTILGNILAKPIARANGCIGRKSTRPRFRYLSRISLKKN
jgi:hypothetical protein